jgi:hypothetical protein
VYVCGVLWPFSSCNTLSFPFLFILTLPRHSSPYTPVPLSSWHSCCLFGSYIVAKKYFKVFL